MTLCALISGGGVYHLRYATEVEKYKAEQQEEVMLFKVFRLVVPHTEMHHALSQTTEMSPQVLYRIQRASYCGHPMSNANETHEKTAQRSRRNLRMSKRWPRRQRRKRWQSLLPTTTWLPSTCSTTEIQYCAFPTSQSLRSSSPPLKTGRCSVYATNWV